mgnify:CR=1 FL=1
MTNQSNSIQLDRYDRHILAVLQEDGRISNQDLADVLTYVRTQWGNAAAPVSALDVQQLRAGAGR